jgi:hypothetical protein
VLCLQVRLAACNTCHGALATRNCCGTSRSKAQANGIAHRTPCVNDCPLHPPHSTPPCSCASCLLGLRCRARCASSALLALPPELPCTEQHQRLVSATSGAQQVVWHGVKVAAHSAMGFDRRLCGSDISASPLHLVQAGWARATLAFGSASPPALLSLEEGQRSAPLPVPVCHRPGIPGCSGYSRTSVMSHAAAVAGRLGGRDAQYAFGR